MADKDIAPELLRKLQEDFKKRFDGNREIAGLYEKVSAGTATYAEAADFSQRTGEILAEVFGKDIKEELLPDGKMYYNIAQRTVRPMLENNYNLVADICEQVQTALNKQAGIGIKAMRPKLNDDRIKGIVNRLSSEEEYGKVAWILNAPVKTFSQSVVDDSIKENMDFQGKAGLYPRIERKSTGSCCPWCEAVGGSYRYPDVPKDVYRRHNNCLCSVDYDPGSGLMRGKTQNVHSKNWETEEQRLERIERAKQEYVSDRNLEQKKRADRIELAKQLEEQESQIREQRLLARGEIQGLTGDKDIDIYDQSKQNVLSQHKKGDKVEITEQAISKVKAIGPRGSSEEDKESFKRMNQEILRIAKEKNNSNEVAMAFVNGMISEPVLGNQQSVDVYADSQMYHILRGKDIEVRSVTLSHNHPGLSYFSIHDIGIFIGNPNIVTMEVVTNAGKTWYISKKSNYDDYEVLKIYKEVIEKNKDNPELAVDDFLNKTYNCIEKNK